MTGRMLVLPGQPSGSPSPLIAGPNHLLADAYSGYKALYRIGHVIEVACWGHVRRKFWDIHQATAIYSIIENCKLKSVEPLTYITDVMQKIAAN